MAESLPATQVGNNYSNMTRNDFPKGFVFGLATSAYQVEGAATAGGRGVSIWDDFSMMSPNRISDGSNGNQAVDMYYRYKDDLKTMKSMGFEGYRFSISWPRIIPSGKFSLGVNREGIDYYNDLINTVLSLDGFGVLSSYKSTKLPRVHTLRWSTVESGEHCPKIDRFLELMDFFVTEKFNVPKTLVRDGMEPYVTLFHWDLPNQLEKEYGGFLRHEIVKDYRDYVNVCFWEFGDRVKHWVTFNEPWTYCYNGYVSRTFPPGEKVVYIPDVDAADGGSSAATTTFITKGSIDDPRKPLHDYKVSEYIPPPTRTIPITPVMRTQGLTTMFFSVGLSGTNELKAYRAPELILSDPNNEPFIAAKNMIVAHAAAVDLYNTKFKEQQGGQIGLVLNDHCFEAYDGTKQEDIAAAKRAHDFMFGWFLEPALTGKYPETMRPDIPEGAKFSNFDIKLLTKHKLDFLGVNYYTARYVQNYPDAVDDPTLYPFDRLQRAKILTVGIDGKPIGPCPGPLWLYVVPWGIKKLLKQINDYYNNPTYNCPPLYITENGVAEIADPQKTASEVLPDTIRVNYYRDHLGNMLDVIDEWKLRPPEKTLEIKGFFAWAYVDNYEWVSGYTNRFGIVYIDYVNKLKRYPKVSAAWFSQFLAGKIPQLLEENAI